MEEEVEEVVVVVEEEEEEEEEENNNNKAYLNRIINLITRRRSRESISFCLCNLAFIFLRLHSLDATFYVR